MRGKGKSVQESSCNLESEMRGKGGREKRKGEEEERKKERRKEERVLNKVFDLD